jgi:hypothetical protein
MSFRFGNICGAVMAGAAPAIFGISLSQAAVMKAVPEQPTWYADGKTEYAVFVYADNSGLNGDETSGMEWRFLNTPGLNFTEVGKPESNDFFEGYEMFFERFEGPGRFSGRLINDIRNGPVDHQGYLATYKFTVPVEFAPGTYHFELTETGMLNGNLDYQDHTVEIVEFEIRKPLADVNCDGVVDFSDIDPFVTALISRDDYESDYPDCNYLNADVNQDGNVDFDDINPFVDCLVNGGCP